MTDTLAEIAASIERACNEMLRAIAGAKELRQCDFILVPEQTGEQVKPAIEEPEAFGSLVRATAGNTNYPLPTYLWQRSPMNGKHYWESETGVVEVWSELTDVTVLRVGLGVADEEKLDASFNDGLHEGQRDMNTRIHARLVSLHDLEVLKLRQRGLEKAMQAVEELAP